MIRRTVSDESGITIVEIAIAMVLLSVMSIMTFSSLNPAQNVAGRVDDEARGLADLRVVVERLSRDLRAARGVEASPTSTTSKLVVWVDRNSNYVREASENITWRLQTGTVSGQFDIVRQRQGGVAQVVGSSLVSDIAFQYAGSDTNGVLGNTATGKTNVVNVKMSYDAIPGLYSSPKLVGFDVRMRNTG